MSGETAKKTADNNVIRNAVGYPRTMNVSSLSTRNADARVATPAVPKLRSRILKFSTSDFEPRSVPHPFYPVLYSLGHLLAAPAFVAGALLVVIRPARGPPPVPSFPTQALIFHPEPTYAAPASPSSDYSNEKTYWHMLVYLPKPS